jgi:DMSO reductase anchor subunit
MYKYQYVNATHLTIKLSGYERSQHDEAMLRCVLVFLLLLIPLRIAITQNLCANSSIQTAMSSMTTNAYECDNVKKLANTSVPYIVLTDRCYWCNSLAHMVETRKS